ncbi:uncharacterized protein [Miscanthus floridulus]|uniref:uncharacterized protein isoform X2 n=1 Tax=Miscanthus floridulus TaxID=154761 RepID=UPI00345952A0
MDTTERINDMSYWDCQSVQYTFLCMSYWDCQNVQLCQLKIKDLYMIATDKKGLPMITDRDISYMFVNETTSEVDLQAEMKPASWRSSRGRPTQSQSTSTDPHLQDSTKLKIKNLYMVTTREGPIISDDYRHGHISYMFVDETTSGDLPARARARVMD